jgi:hypothetical protein
MQKRQPFEAQGKQAAALQNVGAPTMAIDIIVNIVEENKGVIGEGILREAPPPPMFCVSAGIIGLTGEWLVSAGMIGLRQFPVISFKFKKKKE